MERYFDRRWSRTHLKVWALAKDQVLAAVIALVVSVVAFPLTSVLLGGNIVIEGSRLIIDGILGPALLYGLVFLFFWQKSAGEMDAERVAEIRELRIAQGLPTDDLDPPAPKTRKVSILIDLRSALIFFAVYIFTIGLGLMLGWEAIQLSNVATLANNQAGKAITAGEQLADQRDAILKAAIKLCKTAPDANKNICTSLTKIRTDLDNRQLQKHR